MNHHASEEPTVLDKLDDLGRQQRATNDIVMRHMEWHAHKEKEEE